MSYMGAELEIIQCIPRQIREPVKKSPFSRKITTIYVLQYQALRRIGSPSDSTSLTIASKMIMTKRKPKQQLQKLDASFVVDDAEIIHPHDALIYQILKFFRDSLLNPRTTHYQPNLLIGDLNSVQHRSWTYSFSNFV